MLFTCTICRYGHNAMNVECYKTDKNRFVYYCYDHIKLVPNTLTHIPWESDKKGFDPLKFCVIKRIKY